MERWRHGLRQISRRTPHSILGGVGGKLNANGRACEANLDPWHLRSFKQQRLTAAAASVLHPFVASEIRRIATTPVCSLMSRPLL